MAREFVDRPPRIQPELPAKSRTIPAPPEQQPSSLEELVQTVIPVIGMLGFAFAGGSGNLGMMVPMGLMMGLSIGVSMWMRQRTKAKIAEKVAKYKKHLLELRQDMVRDHNVQRLHYVHNYPDTDTLLEIAARDEKSRFGSRLWERRANDPDFGALRLGMGTRPSSVVYKFDSEENPVEDTNLHRDARRLRDDSMVVTEVPVTIPLRNFAKAATSEEGGVEQKGNMPRHTVGIVGKNPTSTADFARAVLANFAGFHSPLDVRLFVVGHAKRAESWQWAEWLPHVNVRSIGDDDDDLGKPKQYDQLMFADELPKLQAFWKRIKKDLDQRQVRLKDSGDDDKKSGDVTLPFNVVIVDMLGDLPANHPLREVSSEAVVSQINGQGPTLGAAIIFLANDPSRIPSDVQALVEIAPTGDEVVFRYTEVGLNSPHYLGKADLLPAREARENFAAKIRRLDLARPFGSDLPRAADLLQMLTVVEGKRIDTIDKLDMKGKWARSVQPKASEWLKAPLGMMSMKDVRDLWFSAKEGGDGVHGMIAGTTGSGKSELVMTLIASLAIKYDPRIVNFVLVDYKGGATIEPFRKLPHTVDMLTNMQANACERMFVAIDAVMRKRSAILAQSGVSDLVKYRSDVAPKLEPEDPRPKVFPHLFIIVDEFAEMITANPDYRAKFESVTRLGRAFGVTLILATQRPAGVVTDQMRANMKFRICLRVETPDDSKELLESPDAAFLPNLGGRGYVKSGNDVMQGIQVAWSGANYSDDNTVNFKDVYWLDEEALPRAAGDRGEFTAGEVAEALGMKPGELPKTVLEWMVGVSALRAKKDGIPPQTKPWPEPLPEHLSLTDPIDATFLNTDRDDVITPYSTPEQKAKFNNGAGPDPKLNGPQAVINPLMDAWLNDAEDKNLWEPVDWKNPRTFRVDIGLIDNPYNAEQRLLSIDLSKEPLAIFGNTGKGKGTFIKSVLTGLAATRNPDELNIYMLDFARGSLKSISTLPHVGASLDAGDTARVDQLMRMLRNFVTERQELMAKTTANNIVDFNAQMAALDKQIFPEIVVVVHNFVEFKESYEHQMAELMSLVRDGRQFGLYFVITATNPADLGGKFMNLMTSRVTFTQADTGLYADIVGRGARNFDDVPGRGLVAVMLDDGPMPLEFQVGVPGQADINADEEVDGFQLIATRMERVWLGMGKRRPAAELPRAINMMEMIGLLEGRQMQHFKRVGELPFPANWQRSMDPKNQEWLKSPIGLISSKDIRTMEFQAQKDGVHGMVAGTTGSGKSELLQTLILSMAMRYDPRIVNFVLVDYKGGATIEPFKKLPHVVDMATDQQPFTVERIFIAIKAEMDRRAKLLADSGVSELIAYRKEIIPKGRKDLPDTFPHLFVIVDEFGEMIATNPEYKAQFESITRLGRAYGVSLILATQRPAGVVTDQMRANMKFRICLRVETPEDSKELLKRPDAARLPQIAGRGYIQAGTETLTEVQAAYSGINYTDDVPDPRYNTEQILSALELDEEKKPGKLINWLVGAMAAEAIKAGVPTQFKPWPDPLPMPPDPKDPEDINHARWPMPLNKPVDASYIKSIEADTVVLAPEIQDWIDAIKADFKAPQGAKIGAELKFQLADAGPGGARHLWKTWDWKRGALPLTANIGVYDNPFRAEQRILDVNVAGDPIIVFGASGKGKTTFLKDVAFALASKFSPMELNLYALDFGRGALKSLKEMPHCGAVIESSSPDRVEQLFRMMRSIMAERQERLAKYSDMAEYNLAQKGNPETLFPSVVVLIDNFAEFKESFEYLIPDLMALVRDGRQFGMHYIITANVPNDLGGKLMNLLGQRYAFTLADASMYSDIVGRPSMSLANLVGRGFLNYEGAVLEFQTALPVIEGEKDPYARLSERMAAVWYAMGGKQPAAEVPKAVTLLEMWTRFEGRKVERIGDLGIAEKWKASMEAKNSEWLRAPVGMISSKEVRQLWFSAKPGGDGVHGMAAGTTGSGKSELLQTLIAALAIKYDPRIVNFVLIDYKGGPTVEPFRKLPHTVDLATNLDGNAVERIFVAITAEMNRRSDILAKAGVADLVDYRKKVIPTLKPDSPFPKTFPHLFVIVDEFAEMITNNPDYKQKFESITRLGRSFGVTLILATQRPSGAVTDQMRANMKFRLCLRVETSDDSKEMLGRPDAATLPAIPGRGYAQVGGGGTNEFQSGYCGANYDETLGDPVYEVQEILEALEKTDDPPRSLLGWVVGALAAENKRQNIPPQFKPWPDGLPNQLPLNEAVDATYFPPKGVPKPALTLSPEVKCWIELAGGSQPDGSANGHHPSTNGHLPIDELWPAHDYSEPLDLALNLGLIDNPYDAEQRLMKLDVGGDPIIAFGASGRGKTAFLKSLMISLAAKYRPSELHMFAMDFARGGLKALRKLPHVAGIVDGNDEERVERVFRMLRNIIEERQTKLQAFDSFNDYNTKNPKNPLPNVLVLIDNVSEFKETYERFFGDLLQLVRDGRTFGVHFVVTATMFNDCPAKLFNLLTQRLSFTMSDPSMYSEIVGRGWPRFNDTPGRGVCLQEIGEDMVPLEFHCGQPYDPGVVTRMREEFRKANEGNEPDARRLNALMGRAMDETYRNLVDRMIKGWEALVMAEPAAKARKPKPVEPLASIVPMIDMLPKFGEGEKGIVAPIGINDNDREPLKLDLKAKGPHWMLIGPPVTGKTTSLRALVLALAHSYSPDQVALVLIDPSDTMRRFFNYGTDEENHISKLPHVLACVSTPKELDDVIWKLRAEYEEDVIKKISADPAYTAQDNAQRSIIVICDHFDDAEPLNRASKLGGLDALAEVGKGKNIHFIIGGSLNVLRGGSGELRRRVESSRYSLVLQDFETVRMMGIRMYNLPTKELPPGRGWMVKAVTSSHCQLALPVVDGMNGQSDEEQLRELISAIRNNTIGTARWSWQGEGTELATLVTGQAQDAAAADGGVVDNSAAPMAGQADANAAMDLLKQLMAEQATATVEEIAGPTNFASVEIPDEEPAAEGAAAEGEKK